MKIVEAKIYALNIPFCSSFSHSLKTRSFSDSIVVKLTTNSGLCGYGEGIARPYVTGETVKKSSTHLEKVLLPAIINKDIQNIDKCQNPSDSLSSINKHIPKIDSPGIVAWSASKTAVELALIDCILKEQKMSLNCILPANSKTVTYTGVLASGNIKKTVELAERFKQIGFKYVKIKIGQSNDQERIAVARDILGPSVSIRLDANGAFSTTKAIRFIKSVEKFNIDSIEQPIKRGDSADLAFVKSNSPIPIMADESIVTLDDAKKLIDTNACDYFNLRISKCGGLYNTLAIAELAKQMGMRIQLGCLVGETAILSAAGRHLAAYLSEVKFVEGSYSTHLLVEDIAQEMIEFGKCGVAPVFFSDGLGISVKEDLLIKYAKKMICVS
ncbi:MAG: enolase C-terminal domain-like protein [Phycisphaerae bacterium]|jgi:muconate cycloisomerase